MMAFTIVSLCGKKPLSMPHVVVAHGASFRKSECCSVPRAVQALCVEAHFSLAEVFIQP